ncbi:hypothetical protein BJF93_04155 [Xaviernesmea oryzae]|uniref:Diguanylate cyclase n=1 Tax=Xaviernesmea oryzae TaxID=464029 RepID=A0A1Q9AUJ1_9HYPH|nr:transporter substrate-binding protein [Xaviernesmea oryzae]OLP59119.1 hypothetical protein BJF93_04155 [Xaviernesmea oryzae]SEK85778.1 urea ABC transporter, urea binding protein [Xaviernesmea oryzae]
MHSQRFVKVGLLHSSTGTMACNEAPLADMLRFEIDKANEAGGLLGCKIVPVEFDPASDWLNYGQYARQMIRDQQVAALFGCWTSTSRKAVLPVVEEEDCLLYYPLDYEGEEQSPNIFYLGATPNQKLFPAIEYLLSAPGGAFDRFFMLGTDFNYPRTINRVLRAFLDAKGLKTLGLPEHYVPFSHRNWDQEIAAIAAFRAGGRGVIVSSIVGDANQDFLAAYHAAGFKAEDLPILGLSLNELDLATLDPAAVKGHYACWNYFMSHDTEGNQAFLRSWQMAAGANRPVCDAMIAARTGFRMWLRAATAAGTTRAATVRQYMFGQTEMGLDGEPVIMGINHHVEMGMSIARARADRRFDIVWRSEEPLRGNPWAAEHIIASTTAVTAQRELLDALPTPLIVIDDDGQLRYRSASTDDYFGRDIAPDYLEALRKAADRAAANGAEGDDPVAEIVVRTPSGELHNLTVVSRRIVFAGVPSRLLSLADVTYIRRIESTLRLMNADLEQLATTDGLTGLANRRHFMQELAARIAQCETSDRPVGVLLIDLDHFKSINDRFGHAAGDKALIETARVLHETLNADCAQQDLVARVGGEEFAVILSASSIEEADRVAERLRACIAAVHFETGGVMVRLSCSVGATLCIAGDSPEATLKRADDGLYAAKRDGRNRVVFRRSA